MLDFSRLGKAPFIAAFWALADQGVVSLGSFITSIVVARELSPDRYGIFALVISVMVAMNSIQAAIIGYPLMVRGAKLPKDEYRSMVQHALITASIIGLLMATVGGTSMKLVDATPSLSISCAFALLAWQLQQVTRSAFLARQRYAEAMPGDLVSYCGQAGAIWLILNVVALHASLSMILLVIGGTSLVAVAFQCFQLRLFQSSWSFDRDFVRDAWRLGRWALTATIAGAVMVQTFSWSLSLARGPVALAKYQALMNVVGLTNPLLLSVATLVIPAVALASNRSSRRTALFVALRRSIPAWILMTPILSGLFLAGNRVLIVAYGTNSPYSLLSGPLQWIVLGFGFQLITSVLNSYLNGVEMPIMSLFSQLAGAGAAVFIGLPLILMHSVEGAAIGFAFACAVKTAISAAFTWRLVMSEHDRTGSQSQWSKVLSYKQFKSKFD